MATATGKQMFAKEVKSTLNQFLQLKQQCNKLKSAYFSNGFNAGGHNAIKDNDILEENMHASDIEAAINMHQQLLNFVKNKEVVQGDYEAVITRALY